MKRTLLILSVLLIFGCNTKDQIVTPKPVPEKIQAVEPVKGDTTVPTGWSDEDTYTVRVSGSDEKDAVNKAKHQILKDIVSVRVKKASPYTDISKIQREFKTPLETGKVIQKNEKGGSIEIYYRITDKGLKKKFERK